MRKAVDETGNVYGRLTILTRDGESQPTRWWAVCVCGKTKSYIITGLRAGTTASCGCLQIEKTKLANTKHGKRSTLTYKTWAAMITRCRPESTTKNYGLRGILVSEDWKNFENFFRDMGEQPEGYSIERKDVNAGYNKDNCIWLPVNKQAQNRRTTYWVLHKGNKICLAEACRIAKVNPATAWSRLVRSGLPPEEAIGPCFSAVPD